MKKTKDEAAKIVGSLKELYPEAVCSLDYGKEPWKLLVMGRLSAQCTDARVNLVCRDLFDRFPSSKALADGPIEEIEEIVKPCGLYHGKAASIKESCRMLVEDYGGRLPDTMEELLKFPGVGRKIANLLLGDIYRKPAIVTDTHCIRICGRLGFYPESLQNPPQVEKILVQVIEPVEQSDFCHRLVLFGRDVCTAARPRCSGCPLSPLCRHFSKL